MKLLRNILIGIFIFISLLLIIALFVRKTYSVEREIIINKDKKDVFSYVRLLKNLNQYSRWASVDPEMQMTYKGTDGTVGFVSHWNSKQSSVGTGEQEIRSISEGKKINYDIRFIRPVETDAKAYMSTDSITATTTKVKWGYEGRVDYPFNITLLFINIEKTVGDDLKTGLTNLKKILESRP